jgi:signal transduction histidine kinase
MEEIQKIDSTPKVGVEIKSKKIDLSFGKKFITRSLRSSNYDLETALSELVDNSIDAESKNVTISFPKKSEFNESSVIIISDDGDGMTESDLVIGNIRKVK